MNEKQNIGLLFDRIAGKYDFLNHLLSLNIDKWWRRKAVKCVLQEKTPNVQCLDVAVGTADRPALDRFGFSCYTENKPIKTDTAEILRGCLL